MDPEKGEAVAKSVGSDVTHLALTRAAAQQARNLPPGLAQQIFSAKPGAIITAGAPLTCKRNRGGNPPLPCRRGPGEGLSAAARG